YSVLRRNNITVVYLHLGENQGDALQEVASKNPDIKFVFHGDQLIDCAECDGTHSKVAEILENNPNVYYGVDEIYGGEWLLKPGANKEDFLKHFENYEPLLEEDLSKFKDFIESYPDQVIWGTDRGVSTSWDTDPDVALVLNDYARAFIGRLDPSVQEKFAYKNAEAITQTNRN
ncbi:MAG TPA: amidohydrolase family protein, partial [Alphaproteobacteria bacterium]|nr:amidohydrolase family protein [Alphaproteobacteria bacterium]